MDDSMRSMLGDIHIVMYIILAFTSIGYNLTALPESIVETYRSKKNWYEKRKQEVKFGKVDI
jgi:hypothetical protein